MKSILKIILVFILIISYTGCSDYVEGINEDPDSLVNSDAENLFQGALLANQFFHTSENARDVMLWLNMGQGENRQYVSLNNWNNSNATQFDNSWNFAYNTLTQCRLIQEKSTLDLNPRLKGVAQVIEAHAMGTATALWGSIPYSQFKVNGSNLSPSYDNQSQVYVKLQTVLDDAIINLSATSGSGIPADKDIYFEGDESKWILLAHSLKARYYLHSKNYLMAKTEALLGINNPELDFKAQFGNTYLQNFNPFYSFLVYDRDDYMSGNGYAARLLDPSETVYRGNSKTDESARFGFNYLNNGEYFEPYTLNIYGSDYGGTNGKFGSDSPMPLVTYGEMLLIIAEADARIGVEDGLTSYNIYRALIDTGYSIGIDNTGYDGATFNYDAYSIEDFDAGGIENADNITPLNALLREIYEERYVYFIGSYEAFTDFGRSNNIAEIQLKSGYSGSAQRFIYPQVEINSNRANVPIPIPKITEKTPANL